MKGTLFGELMLNGLVSLASYLAFIAKSSGIFKYLNIFYRTLSQCRKCVDSLFSFKVTFILPIVRIQKKIKLNS